MMQETKVSPYLKHLQKNVLLYLQILALLFLIVALLDPFVKSKGIEGEQSIWIVDTSATMLTDEGGVTTFERHKEHMGELTSNLNGRPLTIITTGENPKTIIRQETELSVIHKAINNLEVTYEEEQLTKAIDMAYAYIGDASSSIYLFTDSVERGELPIVNHDVKWIVEGAKSNLNNIAITRFAATAMEEKIVALIQLKNETNRRQEVELSLVDENDNGVLEEKITIEPQEELSKIFENLPLSSLLKAEIHVTDDYKVDNRMITLIGGGSTQIAVDQQMHQLLQKGFQAINPNVKIVPSNQLEEVKEAMVVTNQVELLGQTSSSIVLFGRNDEIAEEVNSIVDVSQDSLFAFSRLDEVFVSEIYPAFPEFKTIATIGEKPFVQRSSTGDIVVLADIEATDWPLHPSFPLFLWGIQNEMIEGTKSIGTFSPNEERSVALTAGEWSIYSADDEYITSIESGLEFQAPSKPGIYSIRSEEVEKQFIVQLSTKERSISEGTSFELGAIQENVKEETTKKSLLTWLLIPILLLLVIEWEVQRRRGFTN